MIPSLTIHSIYINIISINSNKKLQSYINTYFYLNMYTFFLKLNNLLEYSLSLFFNYLILCQLHVENIFIIIKNIFLSICFFLLSKINFFLVNFFLIYGNFITLPS